MKLNTILAFACLATSSLALEDTTENRKREAARYLDATPTHALFADAAEQISRNLPLEERAAFKETFTKNLDIDSLSRAMIESMVKNFTADEIKALADFYGSEVGRSAMKKFGAYMADIMPVVQAETAKAIAKTNRELPEK